MRTAVAGNDAAAVDGFRTKRRLLVTDYLVVDPVVLCGIDDCLGDGGNSRSAFLFRFLSQHQTSSRVASACFQFDTGVSKSSQCQSCANCSSESRPLGHEK